MNSRFTRGVVVPILALLLLAFGNAAVRGEEPAGSTLPPLPIHLPTVYNGTPLQAIPVASVSAGSEYACALSVAGEVYCWGWHTVDPWLNGKRQFDVVPIKVAGLANVRQISAGDSPFAIEPLAGCEPIR